MSTVHYTRYTRIIHCRPCCNVYVIVEQNVIDEAERISRAPRDFSWWAACKTSHPGLVQCRLEIQWSSNRQRKTSDWRCVIRRTEQDELSLLGVQLETDTCHPIRDISDAAQELGGWCRPIGRRAARVELRVVGVWVDGCLNCAINATLTV